jgi:hypothetical protein
MISQRNHQADKGAGGARAGSRQGEAPRNPEGDPRKRDGQDVRTSGQPDGQSARAKDDPSRAPESGTP